MYALFHEAISVRAIKTWLGISEVTDAIAALTALEIKDLKGL